MSVGFAERVKSLREEKDLTQTELADLLGLSRSSIGMIETNKRETTLSVLVEIARFFDVTVEYLLGVSDFKKGRIEIKDDTELEVTERSVLTMVELRCKKCNKLLFMYKLDGTVNISIKCNRCSEILSVVIKNEVKYE